MEAIEKSLGRGERNLVLEPFSIVIVTLNLNFSLILISSLFFRLIAGMAMMSLQVVAAEDLRPRRAGTITHLRTQHLCNLELYPGHGYCNDLVSLRLAHTLGCILKY